MHRVALCLALACLGGPAPGATATSISARSPASQQQVDRTLSAAADTRIEINNLAGSVIVRGWQRAEVRVVGTLSADAEGLRFEAERNAIEIGVDVPRRRRRNVGAEIGESHLEISVPRRATLEIETLAASIAVIGVDGDVRLENTAGNITYEGAARHIEADSASGDIEITARTSGARIEVENVAGGVLVELEDGDVRVGTVTGDLRVIGGRVRTADLESVSGELYFEGALAPGADLSLENFDGDIEILVPEDTSASFDIGTYSGSIETEFGFQGRSVDLYTPQQQAEFVLGAGSARVRVETFAGSVRVRRR